MNFWRNSFTSLVLPLVVCQPLPNADLDTVLRDLAGMAAVASDDSQTAINDDCGYRMSAQTSEERIRLCGEEQRLALLVNQYRQALGLPTVPVVSSLTKVAQLHARDMTHNFPDQDGCGAHAWSRSADFFSRDLGCCYNRDLARGSADCMWKKPSELSTYSGNGYELAVVMGAAPGRNQQRGKSFRETGTMSAVSALEGSAAPRSTGLLGSPLHTVALAQAKYVQYTYNPGTRTCRPHMTDWSREDLQFKAMGVGTYKGSVYIWFGTEAPSEDDILYTPSEDELRISSEKAREYQQRTRETLSYPQTPPQPRQDPAQGWTCN